MIDPRDPADEDDINEEEGVHAHNPATPPAVQDEEEASGSAPSPSSDDVVDKMLRDVGLERKPGKTLAQEIEGDEKARHTGEAREPEPDEKDKAI